MSGQKTRLSMIDRARLRSANLGHDGPRELLRASGIPDDELERFYRLLLVEDGGLLKKVDTLLKASKLFKVSPIYWLLDDEKAIQALAAGHVEVRLVPTIESQVV